MKTIKTNTTQYIAHVYNLAVSSEAQEKRFFVAATDPQEVVNELAIKIENYFGKGYELARLERVEILEDVMPISFGANWNKVIV